MKIKAIKQLPRKVTIPGELSTNDYRSLQKGSIVNIEKVSATALIAMGYAVAVSSKDEINTKNKEEKK